MPNTDNMHSLQMVSYYFKYAYKVPDYYSTDTQQRTLQSKCPCHPQLTVSPELNVYLATPRTLTDRQHRPGETFARYLKCHCFNDTKYCLNPSHKRFMILLFNIQMCCQHVICQLSLLHFTASLSLATK